MFRQPKLRRTMPVSDQPVPEAELERYRRQNRALRRAWQSLSIISEDLGRSRRDWFDRIDERLRRIHPELRRQIRDMEYSAMHRIAQDLRDIEPLRKAYKKMRKADRRDADMMFLNGDHEGLSALGRRYLPFGAALRQFRQVDEAIYDALVEVGREVDHRREHYHRRIKPGQAKKFMAYCRQRFGKSNILPAFEAALAKRREAAGDRALTPEEEAQVLNQVLRGFGGRFIWLSKPGLAKERSVFFIDADMAQFYMPPIQAFQHYIRDAHESIASAEFFGRETRQVQRLRAERARVATRLGNVQRKRGRRRPMGEQQYKDHISKATARLTEIEHQLDQLSEHKLEQSIGEFLREAVSQQWIKPEQESEVQEIMHAYFQPGKMGRFWGGAKTATYIVHIGGFMQALTNLKDYGRILYRAPLQTPVATYRAFAPWAESPYLMEDIGVSTISIDMGTAQTALGAVLRANTFRFFDTKMREIYDDVVMTQYRQRLRRPGSLEPGSVVMDRLSAFFRPDDVQQVIDDIKNNRKTDLTRKLAWNEIADMHPVTRSSMTQAWMRGRSGAKMMYTLRSFGISELEYGRREIIEEMSRNKPRAFSRLLWFTFCMTLAGAGVEALKDFLRGREVKWGEQIIDAWLNFFFMSRYGVKILRQRGPGEGLWQIIAPPTAIVDRPVSDIARGELRQTPRNVPLVGELYYEHLGAGAERKDQGELTLQP
jgi:hypothetical protein